tara:strand:+ start:100 stop:1230 length:1131 start_codon:yes stop_codon:yes gene_type:complete
MQINRSHKKKDLPTMSGMKIPDPFPVESFRQLKGPMIDLRTPKEYHQGHWPGATNLPLFNDEERAKIGKTYKKEGQEKAICLGLKIISPKLATLIREVREIKEQKDHECNQTNPSYLKFYCWRGGMRSASVAWLSNMLELKPVLLLGGYKSYRNWALQQFKKKWPIKLIGGQTGSGKTDLLLLLRKQGFSILDLEGLANHRGSSFGSLGLPSQPSTEQYENKIVEILEEFNNNNNNKEIFVEAESANLGHCRIPFELFKQMKIAPMIEITRTKEERINKLVEVYGRQDQKMLEEATSRIFKRLGSQRTNEALKAIKEKKWAEACKAILEYYDHYYNRQLSQISKKNTVDVSGLTTEEAVAMLLRKGFIKEGFSQHY